LDRFEGVNTQVLGVSVDSKHCLNAWAESLGGITYPLLSDFWPHGRAAQLYGVLRTEGYSERAIFVIDRKGIIRYVDVHNIDLQPDNEVLFAELAKLEPEAAARYAARMAAFKASTPTPAPAVVAPAPAVSNYPKIIMYCTQWCPACRRARAFFQQYNIPYTEVDVARDREAAQRVRDWNKGAETTPTFDIEGKIITDFRRSEFADLLGIQEY
jgi:glutaredoxin